MKLDIKALRLFPLFLFCSILVSSCGSSNELQSKKFQKRKYNKGIHVNLRSPFKKAEKTLSIPVESFDREVLAENTQPRLVEEHTENELDLKDESLLASSEKKVIVESKIKSKTENTKSRTRRFEVPSFLGEDLSPKAADPDYVVPQSAPATAILGFIFGIVGLFFAGIILGLAAVILCGIALGKINRTPGMRGRGLAIAGIVIGIIAIIGALIVVSMM